jgi:secondary thiamine-phosphate synthase enzyme
VIDQHIVQTQQQVAVVNVTQALRDMVAGAPDGLALFFIPHTTAALLVCEDDEELRSDLVRVARNWLANCRPFTHRRQGNPNTEAHLLSAFGGTQLAFVIQDGQLQLGTYQNILLLELDGPKRREIRCSTVAA